MTLVTVLGRSSRKYHTTYWSEVVNQITRNLFGLRVILRGHPLTYVSPPGIVESISTAILIEKCVILLRPQT